MPDLSDSNLQLLIGSILLPALGFLFRALFKDRADKAASNFSLGVQLAYSVVNEIAMRTDNKIDDKAALALKVLRDFLVAGGGKLDAAGEAKARILFQAMHGQELAAKGR